MDWESDRWPHPIPAPIVLDLVVAWSAIPLARDPSSTVWPGILSGGVSGRGLSVGPCTRTRVEGSGVARALTASHGGADMVQARGRDAPSMCARQRRGRRGAGARVG